MIRAPPAAGEKNAEAVNEIEVCLSRPLERGVAPLEESS